MHSLDLCPPRGGAGLWRQFTGNEIGVMLAVWLLRHNSWRRDKAERLAVLSSIVSSRMLAAVAEAEGIHWEATLTGKPD